MTDNQLVEKKLRRIEVLLQELSLAKVDTAEDFRANVITRRFIERNLELAIEQMIDICRHLVSGLDLKEPETYADCFISLAQNGIVSEDHLDTYKAMARFRNLLIHAYDGVDDSVTYGIYRQKLPDFSAFIKEIRLYLSRG